MTTLKLDRPGAFLFGGGDRITVDVEENLKTRLRSGWSNPGQAAE
jgi:hypothetical protein